MNTLLEVAFFVYIPTIVVLLALSDKKIKTLSYELEEAKALLNIARVFGFNPDAKDGDKDGVIQEGTIWERKASKKKGKK